MVTDRGNLATYIHDHLAGSTGALELMGTLDKLLGDRPVGKFIRSLRAEISWEREQLEALAAQFPIKSTLVRRAAAWIGEKGLELKLAMDSSSEDDFRLFESLEALSVGIAGKRLLWRSLQRAVAGIPELAGKDFGRLVNMSVRQRRALEPFRLEAARQAFRDDSADRPSKPPKDKSLAVARS